MKKLTSLIVFTAITLSSFAQCEAPIVSDWMAINDSTFSITFEAPEGVQGYSLTVIQDYIDGFGGPFLDEVHSQSGAANSGENTIEVTFDYDQLQYYSAELVVECANGEASAINHFYLSAHSMLNDTSFECGENFYSPGIYLADGAGFSYEAYLPVAASDIPQAIDEITVFLDIGHTYNGDLSIELESPQGTTVELLTFSVSQLGSSTGFSVLFMDGAPTLDNTSNEAGPQGIYSPSQPLANFEGEPSAGVWKLRVTDHLAIDNGFFYGVCLSINSFPCESTLSGNVYYDENENEIFDIEEQPLASAAVSNSLNEETSYTGSFGSYLSCTNVGSGVLSLENPPLYHEVEDVPFTVTEGEYLMEQDFPLIAIPGIVDLKVDIFSISPDRPGFENTYRINYSNIGTECTGDVSVGVSFDGSIDVLQVDYDDPFFNDDSVHVNLGTLCPQEEGFFDVEIIVEDSASIGSILTSTATIQPLAGDEDIENNESRYESLVVASYDPNDKQVSHEVVGPDFVSNDNELKYMVRFQNTGTYYAERVVVIDTLDEDLDLSTFNLSSHSHPVEVTRDGHVVYFEFDNIFLPDSATDLEGSQGFVRYEIEPTPDFSQNDIIGNTAYIYFDFNEAIVTNTVFTEYDESIVGVQEFDYEATLYPNPTNGQLVIHWPKEANVLELEVYDLSGKRVLSTKNTRSDRCKLNLEQLEQGVYSVRFIGPSNIKSQMVVKM